MPPKFFCPMNSCHWWDVGLLAAPAWPYAHPFPAPFLFIISGTPDPPSGGQAPRRCRKPQKSTLPPSPAMLWVRGADSQMCYSACSPVVCLIWGWSVAWKMLWPTEANRKKKKVVYFWGCQGIQTSFLHVWGMGQCITPSSSVLLPVHVITSDYDPHSYSS